MKTISFLTKTTFAVIALTCFLALHANAQTVTVVDDDFSDGISNNGPMQIGFNTTTTGFGLDLNQMGGPIDFASGDNGRTIHGLFTPQTLTNFGDRLDVSFDFTTPDTIAFDGGTNGVTGSGTVSTNEDFKFGLFSTAGTVGLTDPNTGVQIDFTQNIFSIEASPNPGLNGLAGFFGEIDNINAPGTDLGIRTHNVNSDPSATSPSGRFLSTNTGFALISDGTDDVTALLPNTDYIGSLAVEFSDDTLTSFNITVGIRDVAGTFADFHTDTVSIADVTGTQVGVNTTTFDLIGFNVTSGAFGGTVGPTPGSSTVGEANNGIDISRVQVQFTAAVPEPSSFVLLTMSGLGLCFRRRRLGH